MRVTQEALNSGEVELYKLIVPFRVSLSYIFNLEKDFPKYECDNAALENIKRICSDFIDSLKAMVETSRISAYFRRNILYMSKKVLENFNAKYRTFDEIRIL